MPHTVDTGEADLSLDDGQSLSGQSSYIELDTQTAEDLRLYIDDGATGNKPAQYDLQIDTYKHGQIDDWMFDDEHTGEQARSWSLPAPTNKVRIDVTNASGNDNKQYRIWAESLV